MSNTKKSIKAKLSSLVHQTKRFFIGRTQTPLTEKEQREQAYANYRASQELSTHYPKKKTPVTQKPKSNKYRAYLLDHYTGKETTTRKTVAPIKQTVSETRLTVSNQKVRGQYIDPILFNLTGGKYGVIDRLEDDATSLVTA